MTFLNLFLPGSFFCDPTVRRKKEAAKHFVFRQLFTQALWEVVGKLLDRAADVKILRQIFCVFSAAVASCGASGRKAVVVDIGGAF